jgi:hypothetical protein
MEAVNRILRNYELLARVVLKIIADQEHRGVSHETQNPSQRLQDNGGIF